MVIVTTTYLVKIIIISCICYNFCFACMLHFREIQMKVGQWQWAKVRREHETHGLESDIMTDIFGLFLLLTRFIFKF